MKRLVGVFLSVIIISCTSPLWGQIGDGIIFLRGDANNSGTVETADANYINNYLFQGGPAPSCMDQADVNDDGQVDISDSIYLMYYMQSGGPPPPAPFPTCGKDPTSDSLGCNSSQCT